MKDTSEHQWEDPNLEKKKKHSKIRRESNQSQGFSCNHVVLTLVIADVDIFNDSVDILQLVFFQQALHYRMCRDTSKYPSVITDRFDPHIT